MRQRTVPLLSLNTGGNHTTLPLISVQTNDSKFLTDINCLFKLPLPNKNLKHFNTHFLKGWEHTNRAELTLRFV
jgi:hypothetical protein